MAICPVIHISVVIGVVYIRPNVKLFLTHVICVGAVHFFPPVWFEFLDAVDCALAANDPFSVFPPVAFAVLDWIRDAAAGVIGFLPFDIICLQVC